MADFMQVVTAIDSEDAAERLARGSTGARLAVCVQIVGPIKSLYWWQGELEDAREWQLLAKTRTARIAELRGAWLKENHSYDTPEITATVISGGSQEHLDWITTETRIDASS